MMKKYHYYPSLNDSPWPLIASGNAMMILLALTLLFKSGETMTFYMCLANITVASFMWWTEFSTELSQQGQKTFKIENALKMSVILFISSEILFFTSFFWSYFHFMSSPTMDTGLVWPPFMVHPFDYKNIPLINTMILLMSGMTVTMAHKNLMVGKMTKATKMLAVTITLGVMFSILQLMEYKTSFFTMSDSSFGSVFFVLTGFHGIHVLVGFIYLATVLKNMLKIYSSKNNNLSFELASWYWHFVDVVWLVVYFALYYWNS